MVPQTDHVVIVHFADVELCKTRSETKHTRHNKRKNGSLRVPPQCPPQEKTSQKQVDDDTACLFCPHI